MIDIRRLDDPNMGIDRESMRRYIYAIHADDQDGRTYIVLAEKRAALAQSDEGKPWFQHGYTWPELLRHIRKIAVQTHTKNIYITLQSFCAPFRRPETLFRLNGIGFDYDFHEKGMDVQTMFDAFSRLKAEVFNGHVLPPPSLVVFTGRGFQMIYLLESLPKQGLPLWKMVGQAMAERIEDCISQHEKENICMGHLDPNYGDATRVLRAPGTPNTEAQCYAELMAPDANTEPVRYRLDALRDEFLQELMPKPKGQSESPEKRKRRGKIRRLYNLYSLHWARLEDIVKLRDLRKENDLPEDYRRRMVFLYRYWNCVCTGSENALESALAFNQQFQTPLPENIVEQDTLSAQKAYERWLEDKAKGYNYRNDTLIEFLDITPEEQRHLSTIIGKEERSRRQKEKGWYNEKRDEERAEKRRSRVAKVIEMLNAGYSYRKIEEETNIAVKTISKIAQKNSIQRKPGQRAKKEKKKNQLW